MKIFIVSQWAETYEGEKPKVENWAGTEEDEARARFRTLCEDQGQRIKEADRLEQIPLDKPGKKLIGTMATITSKSKW